MPYLPPDPRELNAKMNRCEPPWFLIARQAVRGVSLETLSVRYHVSVEDIRRHLDRALVSTANGELYVRTSAEINQASSRARNDLVTILLEAIEELGVSRQSRLSQLGEFEKLLDSASKLFQWPKLTVTKMIPGQPLAGYGAVNESGAPTGAVNLALIATSPEQLARLAKEQEKISGEVEQKSQATQDAESK